MTRSTYPLIYLGRICARHRCLERLVETNECLECVGPKRLREMQDEAERRSLDRRVHRLLHELSDGGKTTPQLVETTGLSSTQLRALLEQLAAAGVVRLEEERRGRQSRWLWSLPNGSPRKRAGEPPSGRPPKNVLHP